MSFGVWFKIAIFDLVFPQLYLHWSGWHLVVHSPGFYFHYKIIGTWIFLLHSALALGWQSCPRLKAKINHERLLMAKRCLRVHGSLSTLLSGKTVPPETVHRCQSCQLLMDVVLIFMSYGLTCIGDWYWVSSNLTSVSLISTNKRLRWEELVLGSGLPADNNDQKVETAVQGCLSPYQSKVRLVRDENPVKLI